ncbi:MAG: CCA tRNA nucleotidyltransferase [Oligosphaeraceae bacterium]|nr:CCA tRNA nucleotidyltransferase [Oligosphaeraceae bacterium]
MPIRNKLKSEPCAIVRKLVESGYEAYIVGGAVRDLLLGREPKDYDIATSASPEEIRAVFGRRNSRIIGRRFRLTHVFFKKDIYEVSTFRRCPTEDERRGREDDRDGMIWRDNEFGTLEEDAARRDFTVNAMYYDVIGDRGVIDFSGGQKDLKRKVVWAIGDPVQRFTEDPVRMLRAVKLCGQFDFHLSREVSKALKAMREKITLASSSRLFEELLKILCSSKAELVLSRLQAYGLLEYIWPVMSQSWEESEGVLARQLLSIRDREVSAGNLGNSRGLALATPCLPFLMSALNPQDMTAFWKRDANTDATAEKAIRLIFDGYALPKFFANRIRNICYLVPRLLARPVSPRALSHIEYRHARALVAMLVEIFSWNDNILAVLPEINVAVPPLPAQSEDAIDDADAGVIPAIPHKRRRRRPRGTRKPSAASSQGA